MHYHMAESQSSEPSTVGSGFDDLPFTNTSIKARRSQQSDFRTTRLSLDLWSRSCRLLCRRKCHRPDRVVLLYRKQASHGGREGGDKNVIHHVTPMPPVFHRDWLVAGLPRPAQPDHRNSFPQRRGRNRFTLHPIARNQGRMLLPSTRRRNIIRTPASPTRPTRSRRATMHHDLPFANRPI